MNRIKRCLSVLLVFSLSFGNLVPAFASGEEITKNNEKKENTYNYVKEDNSAKEELDKANGLIGNGITEDSNKDLEKTTDSIDEVNETVGDEESGNDISENPEDWSEIINSSEDYKDIDKGVISEIKNKNKIEIMSDSDEKEIDKQGYMSDDPKSAKWIIYKDSTAVIKNGKMPERPREFDDDGTLIDVTYPDEYKELINFTGTLTIEDSVTFPEDSSALFSGYQASQINIFCDTGNVTNMNNMFYVCVNLENLNIKNMNTSNVTDMNNMFSSCFALQELDLSNFDTSKVTDMSTMFGRCDQLSILDLSKFNTSNVKDMSQMFSFCGVLQKLNLSNFNTSNVKNMSAVFSYCGALQELDLSNFDTSKVTDMSAMFGKCDQLSILDLSKFNTSNVKDMEQMFYYCKALKEIDLSSFDTSNVTDMYGMFANCDSLKTLDLSNFDTSSVDNLFGIFAYCTNLIKLNLGGKFAIKSDSGVRTEIMLVECSNLKILVLSEKIEQLDESYLPDIDDGNTKVYTGAWVNTDEPFNVFESSDDLTSNYKGENQGTYVWQKRGLTIIFDANGGKGNMDEQVIKNARDIPLNANKFTKDGYHLDHWNTRADGSGDDYDITTTFTKNEDPEILKLYAQWKPNNYTVKFDANDSETFGNMKDQTFTFDKAQKLSDNSYTKKGYTFTGWKDDNGTFYEKGEEVVNLTSEKDGIVTLYAQWEENDYYITFDSNGGTGSMEKQTIKFDSLEKLNKNEFTKEGYYFDHWNTKADDTGDSYADMSDFSRTDKGDITLYAQWKVNSEPSVEEYTITFEANGGTGNMGKQIIKIDSLEKLNKNEFTKEGYHFDHWNTKADNTGNSFNDMADFSKTNKEDVTLYAQWEKDKIKDPDVKPNLDSKPDKEKPSDEKKDKKNKSGNRKALKNPKTGILASSGLVLLLAASGVYVSSKRK